MSDIAPGAFKSAGYGGLNRPGGHSDPFFDGFGIADDVAELERLLSEHPAARKHLEDLQIAYTFNAKRELFTRCTRCDDHPCSCGDLTLRGREYQVRCYRDPILRPMYDKLNLWVRGAD